MLKRWKVFQSALRMKPLPLLSPCGPQKNTWSFGDRATEGSLKPVKPGGGSRFVVVNLNGCERMSLPPPAEALDATARHTSARSANFGTRIRALRSRLMVPPRGLVEVGPTSYSQ